MKWGARPVCKKCGAPAAFLRTRYFETEDADVWECRTSDCPSCGLIIAHTTKPKKPKVMNDSAQLIANLRDSADDLDSRSTVSDACYAMLMRSAADLIAGLVRGMNADPARPLRFEDYNKEETAVMDIARHVQADELGLARNRLAAHVRQVAAISANAECAIVLVEQAAARARIVEQERAEIINRIKSWCQNNGVPASVVAA